MSFGTWLKPRRKQTGLTQKALAEAANGVCTEQYISNLENKYDVGKGGEPTRPRLEIVDALASALADAGGLDRAVVQAEARLAAGYAPPGLAKHSNDSGSTIYDRLYKKNTKVKERARQKEFERVLEMVERDMDRVLIEQEKEGGR